MDVTVAIDHRFRQTPDGKFWSMTSFAYSFWERYLSVFDGVRILARTQPVDKPAANWSRADGPGVHFTPVPYYHGPLQYLQRYPLVKKTIKQAVNESEAIILRIQGQIGSCARPYLRQTGHPYGVEVVGDPYDAFAPGYVTHPLRPFLQWWLPRRMREQCARAAAAAYVTEFALQQRYPPAPGAFTTHYSSIVLQDEAFAAQPKQAALNQKRFNLITIGTLDNLSKGADTMLETLVICVGNGLDLTWTQVGGGTYQPMLEQRAAELNIADRVHFCGWVTAGSGVWAELDKADLFILPSRQEGLSRATIEAMARGLPCIATTVGGSAELLPGRWLVAPNNPVGLARKIGSMVADPRQMQQEAARNLAQARNYSQRVLRQRWTALYQHLRDETAVWLAANGHSANKLKVA
ncbi:MAG: glycosyltransferase [Ardenticatenaceae bacterium]|nr:glycosyltransferase [Ardenticatenaceae bacterium]MCB9443939.1 glycosyltransferase [Ardenticatenaceae bacterium]